MLETNIEISVALFLVFVAVFLLYRYMTKNYNYWEIQNVEFVKPRLLLGSLFLNKPLHEVETEQYEKYGRIYGRFDGSLPVLSVAEPELLKNVLVKDFHIFPNHRSLKFNDPIMDNTLFALESKDWRRVRNILSPIFTSAKLRKMLPMLEECSNSVKTRIEFAVQGGKSVHCQSIFSEFILTAITKCAFGINMDAGEQEVMMTKAEAMLTCAFSWRTFYVLLFPRLMKLFRISLLNPKTTDYYKELVKEIVKRRKQCTNEERADFLQSVLDAESEDSDQNNNQSDNSCEDEEMTPKQCLSKDEAVAQCVSLFMAGFDSTTSLLSYALYHLAVNQGKQQQLFEEVQQVFSRSSNTLTYESLHQMKFMTAVLNETLRLCPPLVRADRRAEEDYKLGKTGIVVEKDMLISIPIYAMHRDPEFYPNPDIFYPERFLSKELEPPQYTYLPFGAGPRLCLGKRFVDLATKMCLAKLIESYKILPTHTTQIPLKIKEMRGTLKVEDVHLKFLPRF